MKGIFDMSETHRFSKGEEIANSVTHGIGILFSVTALVLLIVYSSLYGNAWHIVSFTLFGTTMVLLYTSSTLLHSLPEGKAKDVFEILDHSSIYFFIAGTYTPFLFVVVQGAAGWTLFGIVWVIAIGGTIFKIFFVKRFVFVSTLLYIVMGWLIIFTWGSLSVRLPDAGIALLVTGGILYTVGAIFYIWRWFKFHHALWHLFVLAGTILHFFCVIIYVLPIE